MKKMMILSVLLVVALLFLITKACDNVQDEIGGAFDKIDTIDAIVFSSPVIIDQDTLDVINTNWWNESVTLENGQVYDYNYIENKFLDKNVKRKIDSINSQ